MVFSKPDEAHEFIEVVADIKKLHAFEVLAWCLMGSTVVGTRLSHCPNRFSVVFSRGGLYLVVKPYTRRRQ